MGTDLISIIIPVYNVETYLERCVDSVLKQSYKNIEIILVDDGSTDNCGEICDLYAARDFRVRSFHKINGGLADARNFGISKSTGKYISFVDSDDYIAENYLEYLHRLLKEYQADISACCSIWTNQDDALCGIDEDEDKVTILTGMECCNAIFDGGKLYNTLVTAWGKLISANIIKDNLFPKIRRQEDEAVTCRYFYNSKRVVIGNQRLYAYYQNPNSLMHGEKGEKNLDTIWAYNYRVSFFEGKNEKYLAGKALERLFNYLIRDSVQHRGRSNLEILDMLQDDMLPVDVRRKISLFKLSPKLFILIWKEKHKKELQ